MEPRFARIVLGYHGCLEPRAADLLSGKLNVADWAPSENDYDWLGHGIYFWEHAPERARRWAEDKARLHRARHGVDATPAVIGAVIQLGHSLDLTEVAYTRLLTITFNQIKREYRSEKKKLPRNSPAPAGDRDFKLRRLDCLVINECVERVGPFETVRCPFWEGSRVYPGAMIREESHIQLAIRDTTCILGVFRPT